ncbi:MAG TPA: ABC transporter permease [Planctomycetaceae bacterium]|nr:ABC transporter permease [Planctomycetaceae bacterium]
MAAIQEQLAAIWKLRYFWLSLVRMDLQTRYRQSWLGIGWSLLHPIAMTVVLCTVFHKLFGLDLREYAPSILAGLCFWNYLTTITTQGCQCLLRGEPYIRQYPCPIAIYPLRVALGGMFHLLVALAVVIVLKWCLTGFGNPLALFSLIPALVLLFVFGWALAVLAGFANACFPDTQHLCTVALQILFYTTPIIYPAAMLHARGLGWIVTWNPLAACLALIREPILAGRVASLHDLGLVAATATAAFGAAIVTLLRLQRTIVFRL